MTVCTFFGHSQTPKEIAPLLLATLIDLIENKGVNVFYVGNQGNFDSMVFECLTKLKEKYPHIKYNIVLAYLTGKGGYEYQKKKYVNSIFPEGLEKVPQRFAISKRNLWMIEQSNVVVTYVKYSIGGAAQFKEIAERKGKTVYNLAEKI